MLNKILGDKVATFFTIIGAVFTVLSFYSGYKAVSAEPDELSSTGVNRIREAAATIVAPSGFNVRPALISKVPNNADFSSVINKAILITDKEIPFMISSASNSDIAYIKINGGRWHMRLGDKRDIKNGSHCSLWLYAIENEVYSFKMDCPKR